MRTIVSILSGLLALVSPAVALAWGPLVSPSEIASGAAGEGTAVIASGAYSGGGDYLVLDIRNPKDFAAGHIPGAVNLPYGTFRGPVENPGRVPDLSTLEPALEAAGAELSDKVLIVHQAQNASDFGAAARVYWTLKSAGFGNLAVLNGGYLGWAAENLASTTEAATPAESALDLAWSDDWSIDAEGVKAVISGDSDAVLIDARPADFFAGKAKHDAARSAGTLEGAVSLVNFSWFGGPDNPVIEAKPDLVDQIRAMAAAEEGAPLVSFCNTGHWAATNWFAASELAGVEGVKLYPESMVGWTLLGNPTVAGTN